MTTNNPDDFHPMQTALSLARRCLGNVWPNPAVGCILVRDDLDHRVVGRGWTQAGGRPHAETEAIRRAGDLSGQATAYVTLEPCDHDGKTPPCSQALIDAGVRRCVIALEDPDKRVSGAGIKRLRDAGIEVTLGVSQDQAQQLNAGFLTRVTQGRPLFTLKTATTLDGRVATSKGQSKWITGATARAFAHGLRANHDAIMIGVGTALADDPELTCRLPGLENHSPIRIVADSRLRLPMHAGLVKSAKTIPTWVVTTPNSDGDKKRMLEENGVTVIEIAADDNARPDLELLARELGNRGLTRVLVESGGDLAAALVKLDLVDRLAWFRSPKLIGGDGRGALAAFGIDVIADAPRFTRDSVSDVGADILETYHRAI